MFKNFNKKIVIKTSFKKEFIGAIISTIIFSIILYLCLTEYRDMIINILNIEEEKRTEFVYIMFPPLIIVNMTIMLGRLVINGAFDKERRKK